MNGTLKNKWILILIVLLLAANAVTIALFWTNRRPSPPPQERAADYIIRELRFDPTQEKQYMELVQQHRKGSEELRKDIKSSKDELFELLKQPAISDSGLQSAIENVKTALGKLELHTFRHFQKVRAIGNPSQQEKFDEVIKDALEMMRPGPPGHRMHGHPPPPGE